jgi:hypothetical protein
MPTPTDYGRWRKKRRKFALRAALILAGRTTGGSGSPASLFQRGDNGVWLDPSDLSTMFQDAAGTTPVTANNDPVGLIRDKSGNGNHFTQSTTTKRPLYKTSGGLSWLDFDGTDDWMTAGDAVDPLTFDLWGVVGCQITSGTSASLLAKSLSGSLVGRYAILRDTGSLYCLYQGGTVDQGGNAADSSTAVRVITGRIARSEGNVSARINGVAFGAADPFTADSGTSRNTTSRLLMGAYNDATDAGEAAGFFLTGRIYGVILVRTALVVDSYIFATEQYMSGKTGINFWLL